MKWTQRKMSEDEEGKHTFPQQQLTYLSPFIICYVYFLVQL